MRSTRVKDMWVVVVGPTYTEIPWYFWGITDGELPDTTPNLDYAAILTENQAIGILTKLPSDKPGRMVRLDLAIASDMCDGGRKSFVGY